MNPPPISFRVYASTTPQGYRLLMREMQAFNKQVDAATHASDEEDADLQRFMDEALADLEAELVDLSKADQERVAQALLSPPPPSPALERAFERRTRTLDDLLVMQGNEPLAIDREWDVMPAAGREQAQSPDQ